MPLTETTIKNAKPKEKDYRLADEKGLFVLVTTAGGKLWRLKYRFGGKQKLLALGKYPEISLAEARERRDEARKQLAHDIDPGEARKEKRAALLAATVNTFQAVSTEWFGQWAADKAESHSRTVKGRLENFVFPLIGTRPVAEINAPEVLEVLRRVESKGLIESAHRVKTVISQVMRYAIATGRRVERDPCPDLKEALKARRVTHMATLTKPSDVGALLLAIDGYQETPHASAITCAALKLSPLLFVRPGELQAARWADIDLARQEWKYTVSKTKTEHLVPLARQAVEILASLSALTGDSEWVFPSLRHGRHISNATINKALQTIGYDTKTEITGHGFRAMARTMLAEQLHYPPEVIEHQLAHRVPDTLGTAYNRTKYLEQRREMMQAWAEYLDKLRAT